MLFNTYTFLFAFLPCVWVLFYALARVQEKLAAAWLVVASLFFYGWWNPKFLPLLLGSIAFNYTLGRAIGAAQDKKTRKMLLTFAVAANLLLLGIFKYTNFAISSLNFVAGTSIPLTSIILPLGISFFSFTQIAFLVDVYRDEAREYKAVHYALFVTYFPHLIAGPILHHKQMMPQFANPRTYKVSAQEMIPGLVILAIGLAKKVLLADSFGAYAAPVFAAADGGHAPQFFSAWAGALSYTFQLYFDFSGYCDMAIGISRLFNVKLPINFNSPYKSADIIDFWRRWHITLSTFLRDYLYIALGGNRNGTYSRFQNLLITMLLGGLWHGASWTFVLWGGLHGIYLIINHGWRSVVGTVRAGGRFEGDRRIAGSVLTFAAVVVAWVFFRATTIAGSISILKGMVGLNGLSLPIAAQKLFRGPGVSFDGFFGGNTELALLGTSDLALYLIIAVVVVWGFPNSQRIMAIVEERMPKQAPRGMWAYGLLFGALFGLSLTAFTRVSEFLYFQF